MIIRSIIILTVWMSAVSAQAKKPWTPPHTIDGQPDLQGVWTNATITPFERPVELGDREFLTEKEVRDLEVRAADGRVDRPPQPGDVGNYNQFWFDS